MSLLLFQGGSSILDDLSEQFNLKDVVELAAGVRESRAVYNDSSYKEEKCCDEPALELAEICTKRGVFTRLLIVCFLL